MRPEYRSTRSARAVPTQHSISKDTKPRAPRTASLPPNIASSPRIKKSYTDELLLKKQVRHRMTDEQLLKLESLYTRDTHPTTEEKYALGMKIKLELKTVSVWFQNKRQTERKAGRLSASSSSSSDNTILQSSLAVASSPSQNKTLSKRNAPRQNSELYRYNPLRRELQRPNMLDEASFHLPAGSSGNEQIRAAGTSSSNVYEYSTDSNQEIWRHLPSSSPTGSYESRRSGTFQVPSKNTMNIPVDGSASSGRNHKRSRTLEWACDRQARRRRSNREEATAPQTKDDIACRHAEFESAMSLLALPGSSQIDIPSDDVLKAAYLLLCFKYSIRAPRDTNTTEFAI